MLSKLLFFVLSAAMANCEPSEANTTKPWNGPMDDATVGPYHNATPTVADDVICPPGAGWCKKVSIKWCVQEGYCTIDAKCIGKLTPHCIHCCDNDNNCKIPKWLGYFLCVE